MNKCDYTYKPKFNSDVEYTCTFCENDDAIKIYQTHSGNFCRFHLPVEEKYRVLEEQSNVTELQGLKKEVEAMIINGESCCGLQMHEEVRISDAKVEELFLEDSVFEKDVILENTEINNVNLPCCHFKANLDFNRSKLTNLLSNSTVFDGCVNFSGAKVFYRASFEKSTFNGYARFYKTEFRAEVNFNGAIFNNKVNFSEATFSQQEPLDKGGENTEVHFDDCIFKRQAIFVGARFSVYLFMENTRYENPGYETTFNNAQFGNFLSFHGARFDEFTDFSIDANQNEESKKLYRCIFEEVMFGRGVSFINRKFCSSTNFSKSDFYQDTHFFNVEFNENTEIYDARFHDIDSKSALRTYQILKTKMAEVFLRNEAIKFHVLEQRTIRRQKNTPIFYKLVSILDEVTTGCGYNATRPFIVLLILPFLFALIYGLIFALVDTHMTIEAIGFSLDQIINPYGVLKTDNGLIDSSLEGSYSALIKILATVQSSLTIAFAALFITTLKRQYNPV